MAWLLKKGVVSKEIEGKRTQSDVDKEEVTVRAKFCTPRELIAKDENEDFFASI